MTVDETYMAGRDASAGIRDDGYRAADQLHADVIDGAHEKLKASSRNLADLAERDRAMGDASDARAYLYAEAEQRHQDRLAALAHHFGQFYRGPGNPAADHAQAFVASIDGEFAPRVASTRRSPAEPDWQAGNPAVVEFAGIVRERRVDANGRVMPEQPRPDPERATFTGDAAAFNRLKFAGTRTPSERADDRQSTDRCEPPPAYPTVAEPKQAIPAPPAGLLADIAAALERTARTKGTS